MQEYILEKMEREGVPTIRINGMLPVKENVAQIIKILKNMNGMRETAETNTVNFSMKSSLKAIK